MKTCYFFIFLLFISACIRESSNNIDFPDCPDMPCDLDRTNWLEPYNRVASDPEFRIGKWINIRKSAIKRDTIIFHNDSLWSRVNSLRDLDYEKYRFDYGYLESRYLFHFSVSEDLQRSITLFNDTTGVFSILHEDSINTNQDWDHYVKIE